MSFLCIDIGTQSCRAALVSPQGLIGPMLRQPWGVRSRASAGKTVDCDQVWDQVLRLIQRLGAASPKAAIDVIGVSAMLGYVFLDRNQQPLGPALLYGDNRADSQIEKILQIIPQGEIHRITGRRATPDLLAPKLLWLRNRTPGLANRITTVIGLKDEIVRRLSGRVVTDLAHANYSMLFNVRRGRLERELARSLGIDERLLPAAGVPDRVVGGLTRQAAAAAGLREGIPVICGSSDGTTAMYGGGLGQSDRAVLVSGSTDVMMMAAPRYPDDPTATLTINSGLRPTTFLVGGATGFSGRALQRYEHLLNRPLNGVAAAITKVPAGSLGLFALPGLGGERAPYWNSTATGVIWGLTPEHEPEHLLRALVESLSYRIRRMLETLSSVGLQARVLNVVGGMAGLDFINQIRADVSGVPMVSLQQPESTCLGSAMYCRSALEGGGKVTQIAQSWIRPAKTFSADPQQHAAYDAWARRYAQFLQATLTQFNAVSAPAVDTGG